MTDSMVCNISNVISISTGLLKNLNVFDAPNLKIWGDVISYCENLTELNLPKVTQIIRPIAMDCPQLAAVNAPQVQRLAYYRTSGSNATCIVCGCPLLESLNFPNCTYVYLPSTAFEGSDIKSLSLSISEDVELEATFTYYGSLEKLKIRMSEFKYNSPSWVTPFFQARLLREIYFYGEVSQPSNMVATRVQADFLAADAPDGVEKVFHVPANSTVYDSGPIYEAVVENRGFTLVKDL